MNSRIDDRRERGETIRTWGFVRAIDKFMSGWGRAPVKSVIAWPVHDLYEAEVLATAIRNRSDMKSVKIIGRDWKPQPAKGEHVSIRSRSDTESYL